jgi:hypothetical protein
MSFPQDRHFFIRLDDRARRAAVVQRDPPCLTFRMDDFTRRALTLTILIAKPLLLMLMLMLMLMLSD